jgi:hypothetical protein
MESSQRMSVGRVRFAPGTHTTTTWLEHVSDEDFQQTQEE